MAKLAIYILSGLCTAALLYGLFWLIWLKILPVFINRYRLFRKTGSSYDKKIKEINDKYDGE